MKQINYNPDILNCIANLSNDEVFTPPNVVNQMLDILPEELWHNPKAKFLDPFTKSGVFLREITKRLNEGLKAVIPDTQERINHILKNQVFGIAVTELTSLLARRTVYCCKTANSEKSIATCFDNNQGNIIYQRTNHSFINGKCEFCGANKDTYSNAEGKENYAYPFIHTYDPKKFFKDMKFDVIIGNPPYQLNDGGGTGSSATPLYHKFVEQAIKLQPHYLIMIIPSRWFTNGRGLDTFRNNMLKDTHIEELHDFIDSEDCFSGVTIPGGVCYFKWNILHKGKCTAYCHYNNKISKSIRLLKYKNMDYFIRFNEAIPIIEKIQKYREDTFDKLVSSSKPFGLRTNFRGKEKKSEDYPIKVYQNNSIGFVSKKLFAEDEILLKDIYKYNVYISASNGAASKTIPYAVLTPPFVGEIPSCCTETYLVIGAFDDLNTSNNVVSYIKTKFFRFLVSLLKVTPRAVKQVYQFVPLQNFQKPWTDKELYEKYGLSDEEINFIESMIKPME